MEVILFGDIEAAIIAHLKTELAKRSDTATVSGDGYKPSSPTPRPDRLVVVKRLGGQRSNLVTDGAAMDFHCYDATDPRTLAELVRGIVNALPGVTISNLLVHRVEEYAAPYNYPHPNSNNPRYAFAANVYFRGAAEVLPD